MTKVTLTVGGTAVECEFDDTETARKLMAAMPFNGSGSYWGGEFYFSVPVKAKADATAREVVEPGTVAFWIQGSCLCLFWGATPASEDGECRAASDVNVVGRVTNPEVLPRLKGTAVAARLGAAI